MGLGAFSTAHGEHIHHELGPSKIDLRSVPHVLDVQDARCSYALWASEYILVAAYCLS